LRPVVVGASLVIGLGGLAAGASLGPEGALLAGAGRVSVLAARRCGMEGPEEQLLLAAGLGALLAAMFQHPISGAVVLLEVLPATAGVPAIMVILPTLTSSAFAVLVLQVMTAHPLARLPFEYHVFRPIHPVWAVVVGVVAGAAGLMIDRSMVAMRRVTKRLDARHIVLTTTVGGLVLGILYAVGGEQTRLPGFPELVRLMADEPDAGTVLVVVLVKILASAWCLAVGYRGGKIFPVAFVGGAVGLLLHELIPSLPVVVAVSVGICAAMVTALGLPVTALLGAVARLPPDLLPPGLLGGHRLHRAPRRRSARATGN